MAICNAQAGGVWIGAGNQVLRTDGVTRQSVAGPKKADSIQNCLEDGRGNPWLKANGFLLQKDGPGWRPRKGVSSDNGICDSDRAEWRPVVFNRSG